MSLPRETVMELMAFADGELDGEAKARAESLVDANPEARRFVLSMQNLELGALLERELEKRAIASGMDALATDVVARIRAASSPAPVPMVRPSGARSARMEGRLRLAAVGTGIALAAGIALFVGRRAPVAEEAPVATTIDLVPPGGSAQSAEVEGVEVDEIDSPAHDISVFEIPGSSAAAAANRTRSSSVVIWVEDETGSK